MANVFEQFDVVDPKASESDYEAPNPFAQFDKSKPSLAAITGGEFNRGLIGLLEFPVTIVNASVAGGYALAGQSDAPQMRYPITEVALKAGLITEEPAEGVMAEFFRLTGAGVVPAGGVIAYGRAALSELSAVPTALQQMGRATASTPGQATAYDLAANFTAALIGEIARDYTDNETIIAMAELGAAFVPTAAVAVGKQLPSSKLYGKVSDWVLESVAPWTEAGARVAATKRLQAVVSGDPKDVAARIDPDSMIPPMQQSADPGILALQKIILKRDPKIAAEFTDQLENSIKWLAKQTEFPGGDVERAVHILNIRQQIAVEEAAAAVVALGPDATPREISRAAKRAAQKALDDAVKLEKAIWERLDDQAPGDLENARSAMADIVDSRSPDADPADIPGWLLSKLDDSPASPEIMDQLSAAGLLNPDGTIPPAVLTSLEKEGLLEGSQRTLNDLKTIRSRILSDIRAEKAKDAPNRNKIRILNRMQSAILDDMSATGVDGVDYARAFSNALNTRFRKGRAGRLLGFDSTGMERIAEEDFLNQVIFREPSATTAQRFIEMANDAPDLTLDFIRAKYIESVVDDSGQVSQRAHKAFVASMRKKGLFEVFPELEGELSNVATKGANALKLAAPEGQINTTRINRNQSRAALLLQANPGEEMELVLKSNNPAAAIRDLMAVKGPDGRILAGDRIAVLGLRDSFSEQILRMSSKEVGGEMIPQGDKMQVLMKKYRPVMRVLQMGDTEIKRLERVAREIQTAQLRAPENIDIGTTVLNSKLSAPIEILAKWVGAQSGQRIAGSGMGSSLVLAGFMSKQATDNLMNLSASKAEKLLIASVSDPELFRSLLVGPRATTAAKERAAKILEREIMRLESAGVSAIAVGAAQED